MPRNRPATEPSAAAPRLPPPTSKGLRTRQQIINAARRVINRCGYRDARISDIIAETGWPTGTFYRYFDGKIDVTLQLLREGVQDYNAHLPVAATASLFERDLVAHRELIELFGRDPGLLNCYFSCGEKEEGLVRFFHEQTERFIDGYHAFVRTHCGYGHLAKKDFYAIAAALCGLAENYVYRLFARGGAPPQDRQELALTLTVLRHRAVLGCDPGRRLPAVLATLDGPARRARRATGSAAPAPVAAADALPAAAGPVGLRADSKATLARIERTTLRLLDRLGYEDLRLSDVEEHASITRGAIYHHYADKDALIRKVLLDRLYKIDAAVAAAAQPAGAAGGPFDALLLLSRALVEAFAGTPGVLRVLNQLQDRDAQVHAVWEALWQHWVGLLAGVLVAHSAGSPGTSETIRPVADAFLAMAERLLRDLYVAPFGRLHSTIRSREAAAVLLAALWTRMAFRSRLPAMAIRHFPFFGMQPNARRKSGEHAT
ncbi:MAG: TetR/AcrR family transcriptional regulator [Gammaproteobacteria bacterium]|nr:TetR/AcrR family transcriptional regulator [Gammaproteobacteria bacterium]